MNAPEYVGLNLRGKKGRVALAAFAIFLTSGVRLLGQGCTSNPIVCENALPGNLATEWDVTGVGDPTIQGFATDISVNKGQTVSFKIDTDATAYRIDIYRLGYYAGRGARKVATINPSVSLPQTQPNFVHDSSTGLADCGNWAVSASWAVPSNAVSGVYIARPVRTDTGGASHIIFIVRDDAGASDMLFQTSDMTWHAYNLYGGADFYYGNGPVPGGRCRKVSYNRPFDNREHPNHGAMEGFLWASDYPMIRWLEANGYNISYATGVDTDRRGVSALTQHKIFLSVGHDEYWSGQQRSNVEAALAAGVHLGFFSGNDVFWKTRWESSIAGAATAYRTLVCYKETWDNYKSDPSSEWTGTWRDPRFSPPSDGGRPENALKGTLSMVNAWRSDPIFISSPEGKLRFWRNTGLDALADGQIAQLPAGVLGFEWDEAPDNSLRPPGLIQMSTTTLSVDKYLIDYGSTFVPGVATHHLVLYRHNSGALVFGAGTTQWSWGLDATHDRAGTPTDERMKQATVNLFADMGVQPASLQAGLTLSMGTFYRAINLGGPAMTIDGHFWEGNTFTTSNFTINGTASSAPNVVFSPSLDAGHTSMLRTFRYHGNLQFSLTSVASGNYDVYVWVFEDGPSSLNATLSVNGRVMVGSYDTGATGHWNRLGPYPLTVNDGTIQVGYTCNTPGDQGLLSGVEVWQQAGTPPQIPPPRGTFYRAINLGGPAMTVDGHSWEANTSVTPNFTINGLSTSNTSVVFNPVITIMDYATMLRTYRNSPNLMLSLTSVPSGNYDVYVWVFEDTSSLNATLSVNGSVVLSNYNTGAVGHWDRLGPYLATVSNGNLPVSYVCNTLGDSGILSGIEVWKQATAPVAPAPISVVSRKIHNLAGAFDIDLMPPASGIECRSGGSDGNHTIVVTFPLAVTVSGNGTVEAQVTSGTAQVGNAGVADGNAIVVNGAEVTVPLTNVANAQRLGVTIFGVSDGSRSGDVVISMGVLLGDVTANGIVNSSDISAIKLQTGADTNASNFRRDVTANGVINGSDVSLVKTHVGATLPP